jgi:hypothetical protein
VPAGRIATLGAEQDVGDETLAAGTAGPRGDPFRQCAAVELYGVTVNGRSAMPVNRFMVPAWVSADSHL